MGHSRPGSSFGSRSAQEKHQGGRETATGTPLLCLPEFAVRRRQHRIVEVLVPIGVRRSAPSRGRFESPLLVRVAARAGARHPRGSLRRLLALAAVHLVMVP